MPASPGANSPATAHEASENRDGRPQPRIRWNWFKSSSNQSESTDEYKPYRPKATLGILSDRQTDEVPGTILLLSARRNEPLGLKHQPQRTSATSLPSQKPASRSSSRGAAIPAPTKKTADGQIVLDPQPDDSVNDPLNWPVWRRDSALTSLGFYCMMGGGMTTVLAAGFNQVSKTYGVTTQKVAFTTGLYMLGLGVGSVIMSPTAILFGKRPVYLLGAVLFILSAVWCALSPNYPSLVLARVFQGVAVSPVECLPSATIAEIYFLHERAYRVGIYTFLLLGGKNLIPLVSAAIIGSLGWRWVFWIVAIVVAGCFVSLFFLVPETFWDRTPRPRRVVKRPNMYRSVSDLVSQGFRGRRPHVQRLEDEPEADEHDPDAITPATPTRHKEARVGFTDGEEEIINEKIGEESGRVSPLDMNAATEPEKSAPSPVPSPAPSPRIPPSAILREPREHDDARHAEDIEAAKRAALSPARSDFGDPAPIPATLQYTNRLRERPRISFVQALKPFSGRIARDKWLHVAARPFVLFAYPSVLWSAMVYALSVGWLIVLSEVVSHIYESGEVYNFTALQTGLIYISPFIGGLLGTMVAGKVSDIIVRFMTRRNGGVYEPEFRLVMAIPIALTTVIGLMGFGWSAQERDLWIVPTIFFGLISFGCCLGSTTSITFCVDSYRQYAGEALVTLNFSKNVLHGLIFSLFIVDWLKAEGAQQVFLALGGIQLALLLLTIPMYIYGKRARMWTVRKRLMEKF